MALARKEHLRLEDISDRALLEVLELVQVDMDGATSEDIAAELGLDVQYPKRCVGIRFGWMRRYGILKRDPETKKWSFTEDGWRLHKGALKGRELDRFLQMDEDKLAGVTSIIADRLVSLSGTAQNMTRREWTHGDAKRRQGFRR